MTLADYFDATFDVNGQKVTATISLLNGFTQQALNTATSKIGPICGNGPAPASNGATTQSNCFTGEIRFVIQFKDQSGNTVATTTTATLNINGNNVDGQSLTASVSNLPYGTYSVTVELQGGVGTM